MSERIAIRREHTRIWFGEGAERWSVEDPDFPRVEDEFRKATDAKLYYVRGLASALLYLVGQCPTTKLAQEKIALIRRALREVPSPYGSGPSRDGAEPQPSAPAEPTPIEKLRRLAEAATQEPSDEHECAKCHESYSLRENSEPSVYCDACAHGVLAEVARGLPLLLDLVEKADAVMGLIDNGESQRDPAMLAYDASRDALERAVT